MTMINWFDAPLRHSSHSETFFPADLLAWYWRNQTQHTKITRTHTHTHAHPFNGPLSRTIRVSRYQKRKPIWILLKQETVSGSGICWAICKSAPRSRQITMPTPHHSVFYRPDALPAAQPTASKHWRQYTLKSNITKSKWSKLRQKNT